MCRLSVMYVKLNDDADLAVGSRCKGQQLCKRFNVRARPSKEGTIIGPFGKVSKVLYSLLYSFNDSVSQPNTYFGAPNLQMLRCLLFVVFCFDSLCLRCE